MKTNTSIVKRHCFGKELEEEILNKIDDSTSKKKLVNIMRKYDDCFNGCCQCGLELQYGEDGYMTSHGTCDECVEGEFE